MTTKYILAVGCSFTIGQDGPSGPTGVWKTNPQTIFEPNSNYDAKQWPHHLGKLTNRICVNYGKNGVGSFYMANKVYELVDKYKDKDFVVMVMWSGLQRYDMLMKYKWLHMHHPDHRWPHYKFMYSDQNAYYHTILNMLNVQNFLKVNNVKYLFLTYRDILTGFHGKYKKVKYLEKCIDWDNFYFHEGFRGCSEWCQDNGLELDDTHHPHPESYRKYAEHLYDKFKTKLF